MWAAVREKERKLPIKRHRTLPYNQAVKLPDFNARLHQSVVYLHQPPRETPGANMMPLTRIGVGLHRESARRAVESVGQRQGFTFVLLNRPIVLTPN